MRHRGHLETEGQGWITGHQKRIPVQKKQACSASCQRLDRRASSKAGGRCHPIKAKAKASQANAG
jgi:hypothetical protein